MYVDDFNLYRRALVDSPHNWLDLETMARLLLPEHVITRVRCFTAHIKHQPHDPRAPQRQQVYLRALRANPPIDIHLGYFRNNRRDMPVHPMQYDATGKPVTVRVRKTEEMGSDVNLATYLLLDRFRQSADAYIVMSNESDLAEPMTVMIHKFRHTVGLVAPTGQPSDALLAASQLPNSLKDVNGTIHKPTEW